MITERVVEFETQDAVALRHGNNIVLMFSDRLSVSDRAELKDHLVAAVPAETRWTVIAIARGAMDAARHPEPDRATTRPLGGYATSLLTTGAGVAAAIGVLTCGPHVEPLGHPSEPAPEPAACYRHAPEE